MLAVDLWDIACKTYQANFPDAVVLNDRVENIDPTEHCSPDSLDLLIASPECTNHSVAKGSAPRSESSKETALHTVDWIAALRPRWFIIENVKEMRSWGRYSELLDLLRSLGYQMREQVINAADFGAPQSRIRLFLVGGLNMMPPEITPPMNVQLRTARDILDPDGTWPMTPVFVEGRAEATKSRVRDAIKTLGSNGEFLVVYYGSGKEKSWQMLDVPLRTITTIDRFALVKKVRGRWQMRMLQPPELARAMSLFDDHKFPAGSRREKVKVCGNGVCATVIERIVQQLKEASPSAHDARDVTQEARKTSPQYAS